MTKTAAGARGSPEPSPGSARLTTSPEFAGLSFAGPGNCPRVMGVVNVTPDSFSDGGEALAPEDAIGRGLALFQAGADIVDVGGESTRPGAEPVPVETELARVVPVVERLAREGVVSIDTRHAVVMEAAIAAGASIVNDVSALGGDPLAMDVVAAHPDVSVILMHMQGEPRTMQAAPHYDDVVNDVCHWLAARMQACANAGIAAARIAVDPGIGFGKTIEHNLALLAHLDVLAGLGRPVVLGVSRKSFIARLSRGEGPKERGAGSLAAALWGMMSGAHVLRVHDVAGTRQGLAVWQAIAHTV